MSEPGYEVRREQDTGKVKCELLGLGVVLGGGSAFLLPAGFLRHASVRKALITLSSCQFLSPLLFLSDFVSLSLSALRLLASAAWSPVIA